MIEGESAIELAPEAMVAGEVGKGCADCLFAIPVTTTDDSMLLDVVSITRLEVDGKLVEVAAETVV